MQLPNARELGILMQILVYSFSAMPAISDIKIEDIPYTGSEFSSGMRDKGISKVFPILEDLMNTLSIINPRLYDSVMKKIFEL